MLNTYEVDNYLGLPGMNGFDMGTWFREHADRLNAEFLNAEVTGLEKELSEDGVFIAVGIHPNTELCGGLADQQRAFEQRTCFFSGFTYGNLMRVRADSSRACYLCEEGEYGWDGWLGCFFANDPRNGRSIVFMTQRKNSGTLPIVRKLCNVIYSE